MKRISCLKRFDRLPNLKIKCYSLDDLGNDLGNTWDVLTISPEEVGDAWDDVTGKSAAEDVAEGIEKADKIAGEAGEKAREDIMATFGPAWIQVGQAGTDASRDLAAGVTSTTDILKKTGVDANQILGQGKQSAISALLGIPVGQPTQPYQQQAQPTPGSPEATQEAQTRARNNEAQTQNTQQAAQEQGLAQAPPGSRGRGVPTPAGPVEGVPRRAPTGGGATQAVLRTDAQGNIVDQAGNLIAPTTSGDLQSVLRRDAQGNRVDAQGNVMPEATASQLQQVGRQPVQTRVSTPTQGTNLANVAVQPQTGLTGAEAALAGGEAASLSAARRGFGQGVQDINRGGAIGRADVRGATGLARSAISEGRRDALGRIDTGVRGAVGELDVFADTGERAAALEADFTGANGPEAQARAYANFNESAGQKFIREREEQSLLRNQAALGGLGGGNIRTALQEQAYGIASQQQQQNLANLGNIANRGIGASTNQAGFRQQGGLVGAGTISDAQRTIASVEQQAGTTLADIALRTGMSTADLAARLGVSEADIIGQASTNVSNLRSQAGRDIANINQATAAGQAGNLSSTGTNIANVTNQGAINQANLGVDVAGNAANILTGQGTNLANAALGTGTNQANLAVQGGNARAAGSLGPANFITNLAGTALGFAAGGPSGALIGSNLAGQFTGNTGQGGQGGLPLFNQNYQNYA